MCCSTPPPAGRGLALLLFPFFWSAPEGGKRRARGRARGRGRARARARITSGHSDRRTRGVGCNCSVGAASAATARSGRSRLKPLLQRDRAVAGAKSRGRRARRVGEPLFSSHPPGAPQKNGETTAPGAASAGMCASCTWMCNVRFRHDMDVCRNRRAHARRGGAPKRKSEPSLRNTARPQQPPIQPAKAGAPLFLDTSEKQARPAASQPRKRRAMPAFSPTAGRPRTTARGPAPAPPAGCLPAACCRCSRPDRPR